MKKKPFWRRVNRGFVVSMALLAIVAVYVLVTQLMLLPDKQAVRALANDVRTLVETNSMLSEEEIAALQDPAALEKKKADIRAELKPLFVEDGANLESTAASIDNIIDLQVNGMRLIEMRGEKKNNSVKCQIDQDVATVSVYCRYEKSQGKFWEQAMEEMVDDYADEYVNLQFVCKKVGDSWKIYRSSTMLMDAHRNY